MRASRKPDGSDANYKVVRPRSRIAFLEASEETSVAKPVKVKSETAQSDPSTRPKQTKVKKEVIRKAKPEKTPSKLESTLPEWLVSVKPSSSDISGYVYWWFYTRTRLYRLHSNLIAPPSDHRHSAAEYKENIKFINAHRREALSIISILQTKGGATKTTVSTWLMAVLSEAMKLPNVIVDLDTGGGKVAKRHGLDPSVAMNVNDLIEQIKKGESPEMDDLLRYGVTDAETGTLIIHCEPRKILQLQDTANLLRYLKRRFAIVLADTGPGFKRLSNDAAAQSADFTIVPNSGVSDEEIEDINETLDNDEYKIDRSKAIVVLSTLQPSLMNARVRYRMAERCGVKVDDMILIPYERYLDSRVMVNRKTVQLKQLSPVTALMFSRLAKRAVEHAMAINANK